MLLESTGVQPLRVESIWEQLSDELRAFIRRRVPDDATADDLLQDVFLRIHERLEQLGEDERVAAWVYRIARNRIADHYRQRQRRPSAPLPELATDEPEPSDVPLQNQLVGAWLAVMIEQLPETYRDAVRMVELEGLSQVEVAQRLGLSISGAKSRVQRGRAELRRILDRCCHVELDRRGNILDITRRDRCCT